jgi:hypothetical protein
MMEQPQKKFFNNEKRDIVKQPIRKEAPKLVLPALSTHYKVNPFFKKIMISKETRNSPRNFLDSMPSMEIEKPELPFIEEDSIKPTYNFTINEEQLFKNQKPIFPFSSSNLTSKDDSQVFSFANLSSTSRDEDVKGGLYQFNKSTDSGDQILSKESLSVDSQSSDSLFKPRSFAKKSSIEESFLNTEPKLESSNIEMEKVFAPVDDNIKVRKISSRLSIDHDGENGGSPKFNSLVHPGKKFQYTPAFENKVIPPFIFEAGKYREK